jgi:hypothetical protein
MDNTIYNIDSRTRNINIFPSSNKFTYNTMDAIINTPINSVITPVHVVEPFNEKNVIELNILSIELSQTITLPTPSYFFLRINDYGNIINLKTRYVAKIIPLLTTPITFSIISNRIKLDQPIDIKDLKISLEDSTGIYIDMNSTDYSFTLEVTTINNSILKNFDQIKFYSEPVMKRLLEAKMLAYFEARVDNRVNTSLTGTYNANLTTLNNTMEYTAGGNSGNYNFIKSSFFMN